MNAYSLGTPVCSAEIIVVAIQIQMKTTPVQAEVRSAEIVVSAILGSKHA